MKTLVIVFAVILCVCYVSSANHNKHHGRKLNDESYPAVDAEWPSPSSIHDFTVPDEFTGDGSGGGQETGNGDEIPPTRYHGRQHHKSHRN